MENLVGAKSPPGSEHGKVTFNIGFQDVKCLNVWGTFIGISKSFFFVFNDLDLVSQNNIWL
jgi:hypothetical protein